MKLRRLNERGLERFAQFLDSLDGAAPEAWPATVLEDPELTELVPGNAEVGVVPLPTRLAAARYLDDALAHAEIADVTQDRGLWAWLALFFFEGVCPKDSSGRYKPGARPRWIPVTSDYRRYYRHLL